MEHRYLYNKQLIEIGKEIDDLFFQYAYGNQDKEIYNKYKLAKEKYISLRFYLTKKEEKC